MPGDAPDAVAIVFENHANAPKPEIDDATAELLHGAWSQQGTVALVRVSASPEVVDTSSLGIKEIKEHSTELGAKKLVDANVEKVEEAMAEPASQGGADDLEAIARAADALHAKPASRPVIVLMGPGLSDTGRLAFTTPGMLEANPQDVVTHLRASDGLPKLQGISVQLNGIGYAAGRQSPLDDAQRAQVGKIWRAVLEASGASVTEQPHVNTSDPVVSAPSVQPVEVPRVELPAMCSTREIVFGDQSKVSFRPEEAVFVDQLAAKDAVSELGAWLAADGDRSADIRGTTADDRGDRDRLRRLGQSRADAVAKLLVERGAKQSQLTSVGVGADFPEYVRPDTDPSGELLPSAAAQNRSVRIKLTDPC